MFIANKDFNDVYNKMHITNIYIASDGTSIKVAAGSTRGGILGRYCNQEETGNAFEMLLERIERKDAGVVYMPQDEEVKARIACKTVGRWHHAKGHKTKGHGGS